MQLRSTLVFLFSYSLDQLKDVEWNWCMRYMERLAYFDQEPVVSYAWVRSCSSNHTTLWWILWMSIGTMVSGNTESLNYAAKDRTCGRNCLKSRWSGETHPRVVLKLGPTDSPRRIISWHFYGYFALFLKLKMSPFWSTEERKEQYKSEYSKWRKNLHFWMNHSFKKIIEDWSLFCLIACFLFHSCSLLLSLSVYSSSHLSPSFSKVV